jgi:hypothetical protein
MDKPGHLMWGVKPLVEQESIAVPLHLSKAAFLEHDDAFEKLGEGQRWMFKFFLSFATIVYFFFSVRRLWQPIKCG